MEEQDLDQHFMIDNRLLDRIVKYANLKSDDVVLEIGPGRGTLTKLLIKKSHVIAVELDFELFKKLIEIKTDNLILRYGNALNLMKNIYFNKLVANIPYSISEPLFKKIMITQPELVVITTGINFVDFVKNSKVLSLIYDYEIKEEVKGSSFYPPPRTKSVILCLKIKTDKIALFFQDLLKQHDKKLKNAILKSFTGIFTKNEVREKVKDFDSLDKSPINMSVEDIERLEKIIC